MKISNGVEKNNQKKNKIMVTGASGFIGSNIAEKLLSEGYQVHGFFNKNQDRILFLKKWPNFHPLYLDLTNFEKLNQVVKRIKPDGVFHAAALHSPKPIDSPYPFFSANVLSTLNILEACRLNQINKIIFSSSMSVYGTKIKHLPVSENQIADPYDFYSLSKKISEDICAYYAKAHQLNIVVLRYVGVFGLRRRWGAVYNFAQNALAGKPLVIKSNTDWDIVSARDVARANYQAYLKAEKLKYAVINIGRGRSINIVELAEKIRSFSKSKSNLEIQCPADSAYRFYVNIAQARRLLNFRPSNIEKELKFYVKNIGNL